MAALQQQQQLQRQLLQQQMLLQQSTTASSQQADRVSRKQREIYVGNLAVGSVNMDMLRELFNAVLAQMVPDPVTTPPVVDVRVDTSGEDRRQEGGCASSACHTSHAEHAPHALVASKQRPQSGCCVSDVFRVQTSTCRSWCTHIWYTHLCDLVVCAGWPSTHRAGDCPCAAQHRTPHSWCSPAGTASL